MKWRLLDEKVLHSNATSAAVEFVRTYVWMLWLGWVLLTPFAELGSLPMVAHQATGMVGLLPLAVQGALLNPGVLWLIKLLAIGFIVGTLWRRDVVWLPIVSCLLLTLTQCLVRGFGHINHAEICLLIASYSLTYFEMVRFTIQHAPDVVGAKRMPPPGAPLVAITFLLMLTYSLTGLCRVADGGLGIYASQSMTSWHQVATMTPRYWDLQLGAGLMKEPVVAWLFEAGFPAITLIEILAPLCLFSTPFRRIFLGVMIPFHVMTVLLMGIFFWQNLALYLLLFDVSRWLAKNEKPLFSGYGLSAVPG